MATSVSTSVHTDPTAAWATLRRACTAVVAAHVAIIMTGSVVRITGSGLGCPDWPTCEGGSIVPQASTAEWHTFVEFGNRLMTFVVLAAAVWVVLAARRVVADSDSADVRRVWPLALLQVVGVLFQAVLGGITVLTGLSPLVVAAHLLASMVLVAGAVALHTKAVVQADPAWLGPVDSTDRAAMVAPLSWVAVAAAGAVLVLGTLVTAAGPHSGGAPGTQRLAVDIRTMAVAHADAVWFLVAATLACLLVARWAGARRAARTAGMLLVLEVGQGTLGYVQYALGVPPVPVVFHVLGAALVWATAWRLALVAVGSRASS